MCGITAICRADGRSSIPDAREFMLAAALAIESRGPDAVGFGWGEVGTGHPWYWKHEGKASDVARYAPLPVGMRAVIGHTRWATHGDPRVNDNNHPVVAPGLVLVHNGVLSNHEALFKDLGVEPTAEVDSEALAVLLAYGSGVFGASEPAELLERVRGNAAIAWLDADTPDVLHLARLQGRPMTLGWTKRGDLVMSSTPETLKLTSLLAKVDICRTEYVPEGQYLRVEGGRIVDRVKVTLPRKAWAPEWLAGPGGTTTAIKAKPVKASKALTPKGARAQRRAARLAAAAEREVGHDGLTERLNGWRLLDGGKW